MTISPIEPTMTAQQFIDKWEFTRFGERQASQEMFLDICNLVGHPSPVSYGISEVFTFEKAVPGGFADAYKEDCFGWEFKRSEAQLAEGFNQLLRYQVYLKTPPLLIVSSFQRIRIQTNFPGKETIVHEIPIVTLNNAEQFNRLRNTFFNPQEFEPERTVEEVTQETAMLFGKVVKDIEGSNGDPERLARYLNQIVFCLYAEDTGLLPDSLFTKILDAYCKNIPYFNRAVQHLFETMSEGGPFGANPVSYFNGDLFKETDIVELSGRALHRLAEAATKSWRDIEPSIFGTLFEGVMDATKRSRLGAHYTGFDDIMLVIEPVVLQPLRQEWIEARQQADALLAQNDHGSALDKILAFQERLASMRVLDPACGSGNFLYVAMRSMLDLEKEVIDYAGERGWYDLSPAVKPDQMLGIDTDHYATELARTALWIGYIQWHETNGFTYLHRPILTSLDGIKRMDAILDYDDEGNPVEPEWPDADFIVGNPPFLGHVPFREQLGDKYVSAVYGIYGDRIPNSSDICCYWFEKARTQIEAGKAKRAGLLATQAIRFQSNRPVLERIKQSGDIFAAYSDKDWVLEGANVHISIVCFDDGSEEIRTLDGEDIDDINADLAGGADLTQAKRLAENTGISFMGITKIGDFEISQETAQEMISQYNAHGKPNSDVIKARITGRDINQINRNMMTIDFGTEMSETEASMYQAPFEYIREHVKPMRDSHTDARARTNWWRYGVPRTEMRNALEGLPRYIATSLTSRHRIFTFVEGEVIPENTVIVFAREDDYFFGVLQSHTHTVWASAMGSQLRESDSGSRYTPTSCFETFPFPRSSDEQRAAIADAASELIAWRNNVTHPAGPSSTQRRTLTRLYNENPTWLQNAHAKLDAAVATAYGWQHDLSDKQILDRLLDLNLERAAEEEAARTQNAQPPR